MSTSITNMCSFKMTVLTAFLLILCSTNESLAGRRDGSIAALADVHGTVDMDRNSSVGPFSILKANVHLYAHSQILSHVLVGKGAVLYRGAVVQDYAEIRNEAEIGYGTICEEFTTVGRRTTIGQNVTIKHYSEVMSRVTVGPYCVIGQNSTIGNQVVMGEYACVASHVKIGRGVTLRENTVVHSNVTVPGRLKTRPKQIVINAPETTILLRILKGRKYSERFRQEVNDLVAESDGRFAWHFSRKLGYILSDLNECEKFEEVVPQMVYLIYSYLQKMHGEKKMDDFLTPNNEDSADIDVDDCKDANRYNVIFGGQTQEKFLVMLALYYDFNRDTRIEGEEYCSISKDVLASMRSVLAINKKCGGTKRALCNGCGDGDKSPGPYLITATDVMPL